MHPPAGPSGCEQWQQRRTLEVACVLAPRAVLWAHGLVIRGPRFVLYVFIISVPIPINFTTAAGIKSAGKVSSSPFVYAGWTLVNTSSCPSPMLHAAAQVTKSGCCQHHKTQTQEDRRARGKPVARSTASGLGAKSVWSAEASAPHSRDRQLRRRRRLGTITGRSLGRPARSHDSAVTPCSTVCIQSQGGQTRPWLVGAPKLAQWNDRGLQVGIEPTACSRHSTSFWRGGLVL